MGLVAKVSLSFVAAVEDFWVYLVGPRQSVEYIWDDNKFWLGLLLWLSVWLFYFSVGFEDRYNAVDQFRWTALLVLGVDLVVLSMLQTMGDAGFFGLLAMAYANARLTRYLFSARDDSERESFEAENMFEHIGKPFMQVLMIFAGQTVLLLFLVLSCFIDHLGSNDKTTYSFWAAAYVCAQMSGLFKRGPDSQLGTAWNLERWRALKSRNREVEYRLDAEEDGAGWFRVSRTEMYLRGEMGHLTNTFFREVVAFITPILCMQSASGVDFVQSCFALGYVTMLDDLGGPARFLIRRREDDTEEGKEALASVR